MLSDPPVRLVRAANASPLTGSGTNSWLVGATDVVVIDPGPDLPAHLDAILGALRPGQNVRHIVVTHAHLDHSGLARRLSAITGAPILAFGTATDGRSALMSKLASSLPSAGEGLDTAFQPDKRLADGATLQGPDWSLTALHTPGHLGGHLCLAMGDILFSGDHVMGWSTSVIAPPDGDMACYMASLDRLRGGSWRRFLPGHGAFVETPEARIEELVAHRRHREQQILQSLDAGPVGIPAIVAAVYKDLPIQLRLPAERNVFAHLIDLTIRKLVKVEPDLHPDAVFRRL